MGGEGGSHQQVQRVTVIGTGMMGPGIAYCFAVAGKSVTLVGRSQAGLERGSSAFEHILSDLSAEGLLSTSEAGEVRNHLALTSDLEAAVGEADLVIESIVEDLSEKRRLFAHLDKLCPENTVITSNTSGLRITDISAEMTHPERAAATHFWLPPHLIPLVEIIQGDRTSDETVQLLRQTLAKIDKQPVVVRKDVLGQLGVRLLAAITREAMAIVQNGIATAEDVDTAVKAGFGRRFPVYGPLDHADIAGLDLVLAVHSYLCADLYNNSEPVPLLADKVARGELGARTGRGFHDWSTRDSAQVERARDQFLMARLRDLYQRPSRERSSTLPPDCRPES